MDATHPERSGTRRLALAVAGLALLACGYLAGLWLQGPRSVSGRVAEVEARPVASEALVREVRLLREDLVGLLALRPDDGGRDPATARELAAVRTELAGLRAEGRVPVEAAAGDGYAALVDKLDELIAVLRRRSPAANGSPASLRLDLAPLQDRGAIVALHDRSSSSDEGYEAVEREHLLWTFEDVLERYGRPDDVSVHMRGQVQVWEWTYRLPDDNSFEFEFVDGLVLEADG